MNNKAHVREASISDLDVIVDFIAEEAREAEGRSQSRETLESGIGVALKDESIARYWVLADRSEGPVGCASVIKEWSDWNAGYYWWIQSMYIAPSHRGKGYVELLIDSISRAAVAQNCLELRLYVHEENRAAVRAWEKAGFGDSPYRIMTKSV
jgi:GNAT superfamily N-acetyltransferase